MWIADTPKMTTEEIAIACAAGIRDRDLRSRVTSSHAELIANGTRLRKAAIADKLHKVAKADYPVAKLTDKELIRLYDQQLARRSSRARIYYDELLASAPYGRCVYCRHGQAMTLDHYVPKTQVQGLSIEPWNLVPACRDCNSCLGNEFSKHPNNQLLHPYFTPAIGRWLRASVDETNPVSISFFPDPGSDLSAELGDRIVFQFERLDLASRFSILCGTDLAGLGRLLPTNFGGRPADEVSDHLSEQATIGFASDPNDRRAVMYEALAASEWYCAGGYEIL